MTEYLRVKFYHLKENKIYNNYINKMLYKKLNAKVYKMKDNNINNSIYGLNTTFPCTFDSFFKNHYELGKII